MDDKAECWLLGVGGQCRENRKTVLNEAGGHQDKKSKLADVWKQ